LQVLGLAIEYRWYFFNKFVQCLSAILRILWLFKNLFAFNYFIIYHPNDMKLGGVYHYICVYNILRNHEKSDHNWWTSLSSATNFLKGSVYKGYMSTQTIAIHIYSMIAFHRTLDHLCNSCCCLGVYLRGLCLHVLTPYRDPLSEHHIA